MIEFTNENEILTTEEVARYLRLAPVTVRRYYRSLGGIRLGRSYRFSREGLNNAISSGKQMGGPGEEGRREETEGLREEGGGQILGGRRAGKRLDDPYGLRPDTPGVGNRISKVV